jgi:hypothetical protein
LPVNTPTAELPRLPDGFRHRGEQVTRLEAFVDAAFAFALTLLVISLDSIPDSIPALIEALKGVPAFALCFAQIAMFWHAHVRWSRRFGLDDVGSTLLSLLLVFLILVYVYPLKILFSTLCSWITGGWIPWNVTVNSYTDITDMFVIYGLAFATLSLCMLALYAHSYRCRAALDLDIEERVGTLGEMTQWAWFFAVASLSMVTALLMPAHVPNWLSGLPGMMYFLMNFVRLVSLRVERRARRILSMEA